MAETYDKPRKQKKASADDSLMKRGREAFTRCEDAESENRITALDDIRFARLGEQWPEKVRKQRETEGRPCLTINKLPAFIRQVVNDARQNKPSIKVSPVDGTADPETADVLAGIIRNIEYTSNADTAYDTAIESSVSGGFGYWRVTLDYTHDDTFDLDIMIKRVANPFSVYGDPYSQEADSSDWNVAFVVDRLTKDQFKAKYGDKATVDWDDTDAWSHAGDTWRDTETVMVAEWWEREEVDRTIVQTEDGQIFDEKQLTEDEDLALGLELGLIVLKTDKLGQPLRRVTKSYKVTQRIMSGVEVLETNEWPGKYIPIVPVYGDEFDIEGKRYLRSLIHPSKDAQAMFNFWRTASTELVALAPRTPYIGPENAFDVDPEKWATANTRSHPFIAYGGQQPPQRQPLDSGVAAGALQESLNASDDIKSIIGLYDASMGARSNETSGKAIMARQREGDVSTFHFIDNLARSIRHTGRIIIDLIPKVYNQPRIVRVLGEDGSEETVKVNEQVPTGKQGEDGKELVAIHDLTVGKYDVTVSTGPSFTTRRQEAAAEMTEMIRAFPDAAPVIGDLLAKNLDWPGADEIAKRMKALVPPQALGEEGGIPPELQKMIQEGQAMIQQLQQEVQALKSDISVDMAKVEVDREKLGIEAFKAETDRMEAMKPDPKPAQPSQAR